MAKSEVLKERVQSEQKTIGRVTNSMLQCKDCLYRFDDKAILGNTSRCQQYVSKPSLVLLQGKCEKYKKEK